jgi:hypothetical protein
MKLQRGRELKQSVIYPGGGSVVLTAGCLVMNCLCYRLEMVVMNTEIGENLGLITVQSSHIPELCAARDGASA